MAILGWNPAWRRGRGSKSGNKEWIEAGARKAGFYGRRYGGEYDAVPANKFTRLAARTFPRGIAKKRAYSFNSAPVHSPQPSSTDFPDFLLSARTRDPRFPSTISLSPFGFGSSCRIRERRTSVVVILCFRRQRKETSFIRVHADSEMKFRRFSLSLDALRRASRAFRFRQRSHL